MFTSHAHPHTLTAAKWDDIPLSPSNEGDILLYRCCFFRSNIVVLGMNDSFVFQNSGEKGNYLIFLGDFWPSLWLHKNDGCKLFEKASFISYRYIGIFRKMLIKKKKIV